MKEREWIFEEWNEEERERERERGGGERKEKGQRRGYNCRASIPWSPRCQTRLPFRQFDSSTNVQHTRSLTNRANSSRRRMLTARNRIRWLALSSPPRLDREVSRALRQTKARARRSLCRCLRRKVKIERRNDERRRESTRRYIFKGRGRPSGLARAISIDRLPGDSRRFASTDRLSSREFPSGIELRGAPCTIPARPLPRIVPWHERPLILSRPLEQPEILHVRRRKPIEPPEHAEIF